MQKANLFDIAQLTDKSHEVLEVLADGDAVIERIVSFGQTTGQTWCDQGKDEWVILLKGTATLEFETDGYVQLSGGDYLLIPAHKKHRVTYTSLEPACVWLAVHANFTHFEAENQ